MVQRCAKEGWVVRVHADGYPRTIEAGEWMAAHIGVHAEADIARWAYFQRYLSISQIGHEMGVFNFGSLAQKVGVV